MKAGSKAPLAVAVVVILGVVVATVAMRSKDAAVAGAVDGGASSGADAQAPAGTARPPVARAGAAASPVSQDQINDKLASAVAGRAKSREEHLARSEALRAQSAQRFASEQVDPAWAPGKEAELDKVARQPQFEMAGAQPQSLSVDCRSSMCKVDGQFETGGKADDWVLMYMSSVGSGMPNSVVSQSRNPDGTTRVEIYGRAR